MIKFFFVRNIETDNILCAKVTILYFSNIKESAPAPDVYVRVKLF